LRHRIILEDLNHTGPLAPGLCPEGFDCDGSPLFREISAETIASASLGQAELWKSWNINEHPIEIEW
jgi:hypothetical protein